MAHHLNASLKSGIGAFALYLLATFVGFIVFAPDDYAGPVKCYATLGLISLATTLVCEYLFNVIDLNKRLVQPHHFALMVVSGLLLTMVYGTPIFIKFYAGDDWLYMPFKFATFGWEFLATPISNHYVPLLSAILYAMSTLSDPTYYGNAVLFHLAAMLVLSGVGRFIAAHTERFDVCAFAVLSFAIWPTFEGARTYFAGGFWLALPVATFLATMLVVRRIVLETAPGWRSLLVLAALGTITVLSSSQILVPVVFMMAYMFPYWEVADDAGRRRLYRKGGVIAAILLIPTLIAAAGRRQLMKAGADFSGVFDGAYLTNLALFVKAKVGFDKFSTTLLVCAILYAGGRSLYRSYKSGKPLAALVLPAYLYLLVACGMTMPKMGFNEALAPWWVGGLAVFGAHALYLRARAGRPSRSPAATASMAMSLCGFSMLLFYILQVGVGRRWGISTALADYYAMFPLAGFWLFTAGLLSAPSSAPSGEPLRQAIAPGALRLPSSATWLATNLRFLVAAVALCATLAFSVSKYLPAPAYIEQVTAQKRFVRDLGQAACSEARAIGDGQRLFLRERFPAARCKACREVLWVPEGNFEGGLFAVVATESAQRQCPAESSRLVVRRRDATIESTGRSGETDRFYRRYYE
jgi:hypothetical protein